MEDVESWQPNENTLRLSNSEVIGYSLLCIATGSLPKTISKHPIEFVLQIRDTDSIEKLQKRLSGARRICIIGDGGISMEVRFY
jgi:NAD(P)H-nitrite reductase large subunit